MSVKGLQLTIIIIIIIIILSTNKDLTGMDIDLDRFIEHCG